MATIQGVYLALFGRPADPAGLAFFNAETKNGADLTAIGDLAATAEYQQRFEGMTSEQIIDSIYQSLFERDAEPAGRVFWANALATGQFNINNIAIAILDGAQGDDLATVNAKIAAANLFTQRLDLDAEVDAYAGAFAAQVGREYIAAVDKDDAATAEEADAAIQRLLDGEQGQGPGNGGGGGGANAPLTFDDNFVINEDEWTLVNLVANDTDADGDTLTAVNVVQVGGPVAGIINNNDGTIWVHTAPHQTADIILEYRANDGTYNGNVGTVTIDVTPVNDVPVISVSNQVSVVNENSGNVKIADLSVTDADADAVTLSVTGANAGAFFISGGDLWMSSQNYEALASKTLNVTVVGDDGDGDGISATVDFAVTIRDVGENGVNDTNLLVAGGSSVAGGTGNDTFVIQSSSVQGNYGTITDFNSADDVIDLPFPQGGSYAESNGQFWFFGWITKSFDTLVGEANDHFSAGDNDVFVVYNAQNSGNAYVFQDTNGNGSYDAGSDLFAVLVGINQDNEIASSDFV